LKRSKEFLTKGRGHKKVFKKSRPRKTALSQP